MVKRDWKDGKRDDKDWSSMVRNMRSAVASQKSQEKKVDKFDEYRERIRCLRERLARLSSQKWTIG